MNVGSLIRNTASQIRSTHFLYSGFFASFSKKSRFFSDGSDGESALYHHARLFRKPLSTNFKFNLSNSVRLMGFVDRPIRVIDTVEPGSFGVSTLLRVKDPRNPHRSFRIYLSMWDVVARNCIEHLKPNDLIHVSGRLVSYGNSSSDENSSLSLDYQIKVTNVNYVMAPPSHVLDSQIPQRQKSETVAREDGIEEFKNESFDQRKADSVEESKNDDKIYLWQVFFANPDEWWDNRRNKKNPKQPDFKHKDTGETLWLESDVPVWVTRQLELFDLKKANKSWGNQEQPSRNCLADWV